MKRLRFRFRLRTLLAVTAALAVCLASFVHWWSSRPNFVLLTMGGSQAMEPFLDGRTYLAIDLNAYRREKPQRLDAVVFHLQPSTQPGRAATASILRVIGLPGETVSFANGRVLIDNQPLKLPYHAPPHLQNVTFHLDVPEGEALPHPFVVPNDCYYLLGDNPSAASDSRVWGALPAAEILSRYPTQAYPANGWPILGACVLVTLAMLTLIALPRIKKNSKPLPQIAE